MSAPTIQLGNNAAFAGPGGATSYTGNFTIGAGTFSPSANLVFANGGAGTLTNNGTVDVSAGSNNITVSVGAAVSNSAAASLVANQLSLSSASGSIGGPRWQRRSIRLLRQ